MKTTVSILVLCVLTSLSSTAFARKPCEELKQEIAAKLDVKGVRYYQLEIVSSATQDARKTVGSCDGGNQRIVYQRELPEKTAFAKH